jgi:hypothetical protein
MDAEARRKRRIEARRRVVRRRRAAAGAALAGVAAAALALGVIAAGGEEEPAEGEAASARLPELPRGGRSILPRHRVVGFYGAPQDQELGALGIGPPARAARRLERQARPYARPGRPVLPAMELIATVASGHPGDDGDWSMRQDGATIARYLRAARRHRMLLILDIQPGTAPFMGEVRALERFLREPDVSLALDPEWSMEPGQVPGQQIGSTDAATVNEVGAYLSALVRRHRLPQKLLLVHRFTEGMIRDDDALADHRGVALTINVDGFGDRPNKIAKYREFTEGRHGRSNGLKLFYEEDTDLLTPSRVLRLRPPPDVVVYE